MTTSVPPDISSLRSSDAAPCEAAISVTPSDTQALTNGRCRGLYIGTVGNVAITDYYGNVSIFKNAAAGQIIPIRAVYVMATNTTASDIVALY